MSLSIVTKISEVDFICCNIYNKAPRNVPECFWISNRKMDFSELFGMLKEEDQYFV